MLDMMLQENNHTAGSRTPNVVAYADDVTIIVHSTKDIQKVRHELRCQEAATGARLNVRKSKAMGLGTWDVTVDILGIPYYNELRILGTKMTSKTIQSANKSWALIAGTIRVQERDAYYKNFDINQRIQYVENYLFAKAWYVAQIFPPPGDCLRQIRMAIKWYIWRGEIFRVPLSTLFRTRETEGWNLTHVEAKCRALLILRLQIQRRIEGTITNWWLKRWKMNHPSANPPHLTRIPRQLEYLQLLATDTAYIVPQGQNETRHKYRRRTYEVLRHRMQILSH